MFSPSVLLMFYLLLLNAALLPCTGGSSVHGPPQTVLAFAGGDVVLPCSLSITDSDEIPLVEWSKEGLQPDVVLVYRDGCEIYEMKNPAFEYRTSFITKEMKNGNISLRISNVQLSDGGRYRCMRIWKNKTRDTTTVELVVGAVSEPKLSVVSADSGGLTLQCEATCWLPEPDIKFLDHQGNTIPADDPKRHENGSRCYTVTRRATLQDHTSRVICRVHQLEINQTRDTEVLISADCMTSCSVISGIAVGEAVLLLLAFCGFALLSRRRFLRSAKGQKVLRTRRSSDESMQSDASETFLLSVKVDGADGAGNSTTQRLTQEVADLKSQLYEKEETIRRLKSNNNSQPSLFGQFGPSMTVCCPAASTNSISPKPGKLPKKQDSNPGFSRRNSNAAPDHLIQGRKRRINSSPAVLNSIVLPNNSSLANTAKKKNGHSSGSVTPKVSLGPGPKLPNLRRRHSLANPPAMLANNRFTLLADLKEET